MNVMPIVRRQIVLGHDQARTARSRTQLKNEIMLNTSDLIPDIMVRKGDPERIVKQLVCSPNLGVCFEASHTHGLPSEPSEIAMTGKAALIKKTWHARHTPSKMKAMYHSCLRNLTTT